jgi:hypothetical protein
MADTAFQIQYRQEYIAVFEQKLSKFRAAVTSDAVIQGNQAVFLVAGTGGASAVTRGVNGLIPSRADALTQNTATLQEWHDKPRRTGFNIFGSQGDGRRILQEGSVKVINRKIDDTINGLLAAGTNNTGSAVTASLALFAKAQAKLARNDVDVDEEDNMFCAISPAANNYLMQVKEFAHADYVDVKPFAMPSVAGPKVMMRRWMGINFFVSNRLTGIGTSNESCLMWHRNAIGYAANNGEMQVDADHNREEDYYWARASVFMGGTLMQNAGVMVIAHDGSVVG